MNRGDPYSDKLGAEKWTFWHPDPLPISRSPSDLPILCSAFTTVPGPAGLAEHL